MRFIRLRAILGHYFAPHPAREVRVLLLSRTILSFASALVGIFQAIFLFRHGFSAPFVVGFYGLEYLIYLIALPLAARVSRQRGHEHALLISAPFNILCNLSFVFVTLTPWAVLPALVFGSLAMLFYWPNFHVCFATWSRDDEDGREVSNIEAASSVMSVIGPAVGGLISQWLGFNALWFLASLVALASYWPLLRVPVVIETRPFPYWSTWRRLVSEWSRRPFWCYASFAEDIVTTAVWPVFVAVNIASIAVIGLLASLAEAVNALILLEAGRRTDERREQRGGLARLGAVGKVLSYLVMPLLRTGLGVFAVNLVYGLSGHFLAVPFTADLYEGAKRADALEFIVSREMALTLGRVVLAAVLIGILIIWPNAWVAAFAVGAAVSLLYFLLFGKTKKTGVVAGLV